MEPCSYINPLNTNPTKWSNICKKIFHINCLQKFVLAKFPKTCHLQKEVHAKYGFFTCDFSFFYLNLDSNLL